MRTNRRRKVSLTVLSYNEFQVDSFALCARCELVFVAVPGFGQPRGTKRKRASGSSLLGLCTIHPKQLRIDEGDENEFDRVKHPETGGPRRGGSQESDAGQIGERDEVYESLLHSFGQIVI